MIHKGKTKKIGLVKYLVIFALMVVSNAETSARTPSGLVKDTHIFRTGGTLPKFPTDVWCDVWHYINDNVRFPAQVLNRSDNRVIVHFIVEKDGSLNNFSIFAGSYPALDAEVLRVAKTMPQWQPGKLANGEIARVTYLLSGVYKLENGRIRVLPTPPPPPRQHQGEVFTIVDRFPQFPGGISAMRQFISDNKQYPAEAIEFGEEGRVMVQFIVQETGEIVDVYGVVKCRHDTCTSTSLLLGREAERIVKSMPNWIPGEHQGRQVATHFVLPITFRLP